MFIMDSDADQVFLHCILGVVIFIIHTADIVYTPTIDTVVS